MVSFFKKKTALLILNLRKFPPKNFQFNSNKILYSFESLEDSFPQLRKSFGEGAKDNRSSKRDFQVKMALRLFCVES